MLRRPAARQGFALAAWSSADGGQERLDAFRDEMGIELIKSQEADGSWSNAEGPGPAFATAVACTLLQL